MKTHLNCPCGEAIRGKDEDELVELAIDGVDEDRAAELIMAARET